MRLSKRDDDGTCSLLFISFVFNKPEQTNVMISPDFDSENISCLLIVIILYIVFAYQVVNSDITGMCGYWVVLCTNSNIDLRWYKMLCGSTFRITSLSSTFNCLSEVQREMATTGFYSNSKIGAAVTVTVPNPQAALVLALAKGNNREEDKRTPYCRGMARRHWWSGRTPFSNWCVSSLLRKQRYCIFIYGLVCSNSWHQPVRPFQSML